MYFESLFSINFVHCFFADRHDSFPLSPSSFRMPFCLSTACPLPERMHSATNAAGTSWQFGVLVFTQSFWEVRGISIIFLVHRDTARFIACLGWQTVFEDCKNCALLGTLAPRRGLPASPWSVSSTGLLLESDSYNESVLGFQSGGNPASTRQTSWRALCRCRKCLEPWGLDRAPFRRGLKIPYT